MSAANLRCPKSRILFQFYQDVSRGSFDNTTAWGFEIKKPTEDILTPRWAMVKVIGKNVKHVKPGQYILIEPSMWTLGFTYEGEKYWATAEEKLIAVSDEAPKGIV